MKIKIVFYFFAIILFSSTIIFENSFAQTKSAESMFNLAKIHFVNGEYKEAIVMYDEILENFPDNISTLKMKGIAQSNLNYHEKSLGQFFKILQYNPNDVVALAGMGVGFGNLGEYEEAAKYFEEASKEKPNSIVIKNYKEFIGKVISKYPYNPTDKPKGLEKEEITSIPQWIKPIAKWWVDGDVNDDEFASAIAYLINKKIIQIPQIETQETSEGKIPEWVKNNANWWADGSIDDDAFISGIQYMVESNIIIVNQEESIQRTQEELDSEFYLFERYIKDISNNISKEKRYIEYPNPSQDVIKKFLRDYIKWNFENEVKKASDNFPDPSFEVIDDTYIINYKVFINEQPTGLPLDHVSTLTNSFNFWEKQELSTNNEKAKMKFEITNKKYEANVWVTWVIRDIGEGVLGHAHLGKGVVEVTLGDYNCDGSFQLYDVKSVEDIMTHELGHSIGLHHVEEQDNIMYPSLSPSYAYCLLS
mgnify:CR=1 FL=1